MNDKNSQVKYLAYLRKSSEQEDRQVLSIDSQRDELKLGEQREQLLVVDWMDEAHSAKRKGRPIFNEMISRLEKSEANAIYTWNINRLSRNAVDTGTLIDLLDRNILREIKTPQQIFRNTPNDKFLLTLLGGQAKLENDNKGEDVKRGLEKKAKMGWRPSGVPVGYRNTPHREKGFKTIEKDIERFHLVRRMWDLMLTGNHSIPQILKMSKEWGLTSVQHRNIGGKPLIRSYVYKNIFTNPFFYGWFQYKSRDTGELVWQKGEHEPMVTQEEYERVQILLGRRAAPQPKRHHEMAFTGRLMRCAVCESSITAEHKVKRNKNGNVHDYIYYHCTKKKNPNCTQKSIELKELNRQVIELLNSITISERFKDWAIKNLHEVRKTEANTHETVLKNKHKELETVTNQLEALLLKFTSPDNAQGTVISTEEYQTCKNQLVTRKNALESELTDQGKELEQWVELSERTFNFACYARYWFENGDNITKRSILGCLGSNLVLKDQKINVELHPFFLNIFENKETLNSEDTSDRTSKKPSVKRQKGTFVPSRPIGLALADDFGTIDWTTEYPFPSIALNELRELLA